MQSPRFLPLAHPLPHECCTLPTKQVSLQNKQTVPASFMRVHGASTIKMRWQTAICDRLSHFSAPFISSQGVWREAMRRKPVMSLDPAVWYAFQNTHSAIKNVSPFLQSIAPALALPYSNSVVFNKDERLFRDAQRANVADGALLAPLCLSERDRTLPLPPFQKRLQ